MNELAVRGPFTSDESETIRRLPNNELCRYPCLSILISKNLISPNTYPLPSAWDNFYTMYFLHSLRKIP